MTSRIANRSKKRAAQEREYAKARREHLEENPMCAIHNKTTIDIHGVYHIDPICWATTIHHKKGRIGPLLTDRRYFLSVCMEGHRWIEAHPIEAKKLGYSLSRLSK